MKPFAIATLRRNSVREIYADREQLDLDPEYQRQSEIWGLSKRQLFIDSIINGFDIPKLYFHQLPWTKGYSPYKYAIVDGKQRLETLWKFLEDGFSLGDDFEFLEDPDIKAAGLTYSGLALQHPGLAARIDAFRLPIVVMETDDLELIEELFSRLNEAVPLNAPEKRNALGGPLPQRIRKLARHEFLLTRVPFPNNRYRHLDLATKFLYIEYRDDIVDLKKRNLDEFVISFKRNRRESDTETVLHQATTVLDSMCRVFQHQDHLLSSVGMIAVYYHLFRDVASRKIPARRVKRSSLVELEDLREQNRIRAREAEDRGRRGEPPPRGTPPIDPSLLEFDRLMQSPNDASALKYRYDALRRFLGVKEKGRKSKK